MPAFALDLDPDGIRLFRRESDAWTLIDAVALDDPALPKRLRAMQSAAAASAEGALETTLVIPPSQILYTDVRVPPGVISPHAAEVAQALDGLTPCPVDEMVFDWRMEGDTARVAALDINTLDEAESFAASYGFNPVRFIAWPEPGEFPGLPDFGPTQFALHRAEDAAPALSGSAHDGPEPVQGPATSTEQPEPSLAPPVSAPPPRPAGVESARRSSPTATLAATAVAALLTFGALVWTAYYLVSDPGSGLPEVADTPELQSEGQIAEPRLAPSRLPPTLAEDLPLPVLPDAAGIDEIAGMTARRNTELFVGTAPDPATEVGLLDSADIWQVPPPPLIEPIPGTIDDLYLAAIDPAVEGGDAFALAPASEDHAKLDEPPLPPRPGEAFDLDENGLVVATPEGALTPNGVTVTAGPPARRPPLRPVTAVLVPDPEVALALAGKLPRARPDGLVERMERSRFGGRTLSQLAELRPRPRPASAQQKAMPDDAPPSALAVAVSRAPTYRPNDFAAIVAAAQSSRTNTPATGSAVVAASAASVAPIKPTIPSSASVARQATMENAIDLGRLNLIGVYGSASDRRALLRLPSGRYVKVKVGDRVDGGQVAAIGDSELRYVKGGRSHTLSVPSG